MILNIIGIILWIIIGILSISEGVIKKDYKVGLIHYIIIWCMFIFSLIVGLVK